MIFTLNTDNQTAEMLEGQRRYREMMASEYAAGVIDTEEKFNKVIAEKDVTIADQAAELANKNSQIANKDAQIANKDSTIAEQADIIKKLQAELDSMRSKN